MDNTLTKAAMACAALFLLASSMGCDPHRKKACEWQLSSDRRRGADKGLIALCAVNMRSKKKLCGLQTTLTFAKKVYGKTFRYVDIKVKAFGQPRTIQEMAFCQPSPNRRR